MKTWTALSAFCLLGMLAGCGSYHVTVYGKSGAAYMAPDLCGALVACQKAGEPSCTYPTSTMQTLDGKAFETAQCKTVLTK